MNSARPLAFNSHNSVGAATVSDRETYDMGHNGNTLGFKHTRSLRLSLELVCAVDLEYQNNDGSKLYFGKI